LFTFFKLFKVFLNVLCQIGNIRNQPISFVQKGSMPTIPLAHLPSYCMEVWTSCGSLRQNNNYLTLIIFASCIPDIDAIANYTPASDRDTFFGPVGMLGSGDWF